MIPRGVMVNIIHTAWCNAVSVHIMIQQSNSHSVKAVKQRVLRRLMQFKCTLLKGSFPQRTHISYNSKEVKEQQVIPYDERWGRQ